ncbi:MAG: DUF721 domain-containing protein [Actinomycetota bacterium]
MSRAGRPVDPADRDPTPLARALDEVTGKLGMAPTEHLSGVFAHWEEVAGPVVSAHARPIGLRDHVLHLEVDEPGWATQLRLLERDLVARLDEHLGAGSVTAVRVRVTGRSHRSDPGG